MSCRRSTRLNNCSLSPAPVGRGRGRGQGGGYGAPFAAFAAMEAPAHVEPASEAGAAQPRGGAGAAVPGEEAPPPPPP
jgi:hypothetical protein